MNEEKKDNQCNIESKSNLEFGFSLSFVKGVNIKCERPFDQLEDFGIKVREYL